MHTVGPWTWVETPSAHSLDNPPNTPDKIWDGKSPLSQYPSFDELRGGDGQPVLAGVPCNDSTAEIGIQGNVNANAKAISAVPELIAALQTLTQLCYEVGQYPLNVEDAKTALRKAGIE